ncbi:hypothetical protein [Spelaeicoccus albus]|uniref:LPXTG-motif cell wall-anchored protein n=1 Tax=Spelaeicoccus albus TaxID=1280376 RepID=A0A7Z0D4Y1_9MICO|nr:hypothetical protein [Spelaeicoccus albus]NYI68953.1 hypothetical protein [Spelaeicoccus albus]
MSRTRIIRFGGVVVAAVLATALSAAPAPADDGDLRVSTTGTDWTATLHDSLFDTATYVPGDSHSAELFVKNASDSPAALRVELVDVSGTMALRRDLRLQTEPTNDSGAPGRSGTTVGLSRSGLGRPAVMAAKGSVPAHGVVPMHLTMTLPAASGNESMHGHVNFAVKVTLGDSRVVIPGTPPDHQPPDESVPPGGSTAPMPRTGAEPALLIALAAILLGIGTAAAMAARRSRKDRS